MKKIFALFLCITMTTLSFAQDDLLNDLMKEQDTTTELLPKKMLLTQRVLWGQKGLLRPISPLTATNREKELKLRRGMLVAHQVLGFVTLGGMVGQGITGTQLYKGSGRVGDIHEGLAVAVNTTYSATAIMSLFTPPPLINRDKKLSAIRLHKWLAVVHMGGMIGTNILANAMEESRNIDDYNRLKKFHRAAAFTTFASYAAAVITIKF
ncbi:MAG: hypothetical protein RLZZ420_1371 [Bacteroidota bacterium]|jgi:hypothetical protein